MTGHEMAALPAGGEDIGRLTESFLVFNRVTRDLEAAYGRLRMRAESIDQRLREANGQLRGKVAELERVTGHLHGVLDAIPCGVVTSDVHGTIVSVNRAAERIMGRAASELVGRDPRTLRTRDGAALLCLGNQDGAPALEREIESLDGARRRVASTVTRLEDGGSIEVLSDLTEVAHLRAQLNRLDTLAALGEMAAGIAHEIRNPLNGIEGFAGLLGRMIAAPESIDRPAAGRYVDRVRRGVSEVNEIVSNLLLWARPERLMRSAFGLGDLIREIVADAGVLAGSATHARITVDPENDGTQLAADRVKLKMVFSNLVKNALEATSGLVAITLARRKDGIQVRVEDDGPGVPEDLRRRLFRPFTTGKASGTGLGLAVARKLVEVHGGELVLEDGTLGGAAFVVSLPERCVVAQKTIGAAPLCVAGAGA